MAQRTTAPQAAEMTNVDHSTVFRWVSNGHLPARRAGLSRTIYINIDDLRQFARENGYSLGERRPTKVNERLPPRPPWKVDGAATRSSTFTTE